jgi:3-oxoacyl-[acyl-carrier protein] reductase
VHCCQVIGLTKAMGKEYAETGITVNAVAPAVVRTEMVAKMPATQVCFAS